MTMQFNFVFDSVYAWIMLHHFIFVFYLRNAIAIEKNKR